MQRGVRQHEAELPVARRHRVGDQARRPARRGSSTIGRRGLVSRASASSSTSHSSRAAATSGTITANGLSSRCLARAQPGRGGLAARVHRQVVPAQPLDRQHLPVVQDAHRRGQHIISLPNASAGLAG